MPSMSFVLPSLTLPIEVVDLVQVGVLWVVFWLFLRFLSGDIPESP